MAKELKIRVGEEEGVLVLFEDKAPKICKKLLVSLPLKSVAIIAKVAGLELMVRAPFIVDVEPENEVKAQQAGNGSGEAGVQNEVIELLEELVLYLGRLNYWMEPVMPWPELIQTFNSARS